MGGHSCHVTEPIPGQMGRGCGSRKATWDKETLKADFDGGTMLTPQMFAPSILHTVVLPPGAVIDELTLMPAIGTV